MVKYLISACLVGEQVRYDGQDCLEAKLNALIENGQAIYVCPEVIGGLSIPRHPAEIMGGDGADVLAGRAKVIDTAGVDVTEAFIKGAHIALKLAQRHHVSHVILKSNSPSCGSQLIYDGSFSGQKIVGNGVTAALLKQHGFQVWTEQVFLDQLKLLEFFQKSKNDHRTKI